MCSNNPRSRPGVALLLMLASLPAAAWDWSVPLQTSQTALEGPAVRTVAADDAGALWVAGTVKSAPVLLRYAADGSRQMSAFEPPGSGPYGTLLPAADGGMLTVGECRVQKYTQTVARAWQRTFDCTSDGSATIWPDNDDGTLWVSQSGALSRLATDGQVARRLSPSPGEPFAVDRRNGRIALTVRPAAGAPYIVMLDRDMRERWRWSGTALNGATRVAGSIAPDGTLRLATYTDRRVQVVSLDTAGVQRWSATLDGEVTIGTPALTAKVLPNGDTWLFVDAVAATVPALVRLDAAGQVRASVSQPALKPPGLAVTVSSVAIAPNGDFVVGRHGWLHRVGTDGAIRMSWVWPQIGTQPIPPDVQVVAIGADGSVLALLPGPTLLKVDAGGREIAPPSFTAPATGMNVQHIPLGDGSVAALATDERGKRQLLRVDAAGNVLWRRDIAGTWVGYPSLQAGGPPAALQICIADTGAIGDAPQAVIAACYAAADGAERWSKKIGDVGTQTIDAQLRVAGDGSVIAWHTVLRDGQYPLYTTRISPEGVVRSVVEGAGGSVVRLQAYNPDYAMLEYEAGEFAVVDHDGGERARFRADGWPGGFTVGADGSTVQLGMDWATMRLDVFRRDAQGTLRWSAKVDGVDWDPINVAIGDGAVYLSTCCTTGADGGNLRAAMRLADTDGRVAWRTEYPQPSFAVGTGRPVLGRDGKTLAIVGGGARTIDIALFDTNDGTLLRRDRAACAGPSCAANAPFVDANDRLHVINAGVPGPVALSAKSFRSAPTRLDQPGLTGAWWAPYANGEGFVLDWLPSSRTLFMPWFTFSREGGNDPAGQRWYSIAGEVPANATRVELPIAEAVGGAFDDPQAVTRRVIGKATLNFTDCDNGTLQYTFDAPYNGGATGTITLSRLSPATQSCVLADGSVQTRAVAPVNGFDARMSGSWYEEATSGQGLQFTVQPGGVFFAPWFTFDPKGAADDPDNKRWLSIQGSLANANNGTVELPIAQAIGGAFDSVPTNNFSIVGKATLTMQSCERAKIDYRFDDNELAGAVRGKTGTLDLVKAGGCTP